MKFGFNGFQPLRWAILVACAMSLAACAETQFIAQTAKRVSVMGEEATPMAPAGVYKVGKPYQISGVWYYPKVDYSYKETGIASWYGPNFHGKVTANGELFNQNALTAAHRTLPMPSFVRVTNLENGRSLTVRVNDRGPYARGRIIDVSRRAAQLLGFEANGTARVEVDILPDESRAIAARMTGGSRQVAAADSPLTVKRLPVQSVGSENLPPPPGGTAATARPVAPLPSPGPTVVASRDRTVEMRELANPVKGVVTEVPVKPTKIFVQAGAFAVYDNANRVRARLAGVGNVVISPVLINDRDLFRVRVGPIATVEDADLILDRVISTGYNDAHIIVDR